MNRRTLLRGMAAGAAGLLLPPSVGEVAAEVERRYWSLGAMPGRVSNLIVMHDHPFAPILLLSSDMGITRIDRAMRHERGIPILTEEVLNHARWLRARGARDLMLKNERMGSDPLFALSSRYGAGMASEGT